MRRQRFIVPLVLACWLCGCASAARGAPAATAPAATPAGIEIDFRGARNLGNETTDQHGRAFPVRGLSGIAWLGGDHFLAVMDNSDKLVRLRIRFNDDGSIASADYAGGITLAEPHDFEGIAPVAGDPHHVLLSEEDTPAVREFDLNSGAQTRVLPTPRVFLPPNLRNNLGFEALCATSGGGGGDVWTMNEGALKVDGERATVDHGTIVRLLHFRRDPSGDYRAAEQFAYATDPIHRSHSDTNGLSRNGVSELLALPDGRLIAVERSLAVNGPAKVLSDFRNSLYLIDTTGATDVSGEPFASGLKGRVYRPVSKTLVWSHTGLVIGNMEGLTVGPEISPGRRVMVGVVDNNGIAFVANRVIAFTLRLGAAPSPQAAQPTRR